MIPTEANQTICVVGPPASAVPSLRPLTGRSGTRFRGMPEAAEATPEAEARVLRSEDLHTKVYVNQVETLWNLADARALARLMDCPVLAGSLWRKGVFSMLVIIRGAGDLATGIALRLKKGAYIGDYDRYTGPNCHPADRSLLPGHRAGRDKGGGCHRPPGGRHRRRLWPFARECSPGAGGPGGSLYLDFEAGRGGGRHPGQAESGHPDHRCPGGHRRGAGLHCRGGLSRGGGRPCGATAWAG